MTELDQPIFTQPITASGTTVAYPVPSVVTEVLGLLVQVSAISGATPGVTVKVQWSDDGTNFVDANPADTLPAITAQGGLAAQFAIKGVYYRLAYTLAAGTTSVSMNAYVDFP